MGTVYKAEHTRVSHTVAIKFISEDLLADPIGRERFAREAQAVASIDHPNVCRFYAIDETPEGRLYIIISFCEGETLAARLARGPLPIAEAVEIAACVADGLAHAHRKQIVHRDIKPANLLFAADGQVKIADFGLAMLLERTQVSRSDVTVGTRMYMSPEQASSSRVDGRSDIFSLGSVLYEMLTGSPPFAAGHPEAVVYRIKSEAYTPVPELRPDVPASLVQVVDRSLAKPLDERYQSASEMADDLFRVLAEIAPERMLRRRRQTERRVFRRVLPFAVAALLVAVAIWQFGNLPRWTKARHPELTVAVLAPGTPNDADHDLVSGLSRDIGDRIRRSGDRKIWSIPASRIRLAGPTEPDETPGLVGANCLLVVRTVPLSGATKVEIERRDYASAVASSRVHPLAGNDEGIHVTEVGRVLREVLNVKAGDRASGGYTELPAAYQQYLIGLGNLESPTPDVDAAERAFLEAVSADSTFSRAWAALGDTYRLRFEATEDTLLADKATRACRTALRLFRDQAEPWVTLGQLSIRRNDLAAAEAAFQSALNVDRRNPDALREVAGVYEATNRLSDAEAMYVLATRENPGDISAHELLGYFYYIQGEHREAIPEFRRNTELAKDYAQTYNYLGACYFALDCWEDATTAFERSFGLRKSYPACSNLGTLYYMDQRFDDAARMYQWATEYRKTQETVGFLAAACHWIPEQRERSNALYAEAIALADAARRDSPRDAYVLAELAGFHAVARSDSAEALADRALALLPNDGTILYRCALTYELLGKREKALVLLGRAMKEGCSRRQIASERFLAELRNDSRYELLIAEAGKPGVDCSALH